MSATTGSPGAWRAWLDDAAPKSQWQARLGEASRVVGKLAANPLAAVGLVIVAALPLAALFAPWLAGGHSPTPRRSASGSRPRAPSIGAVRTSSGATFMRASCSAPASPC